MYPFICMFLIFAPNRSVLSVVVFVLSCLAREVIFKFVGY